MPDVIVDPKRELRRKCQQIRASLGEDHRRRASLAICERIEGWAYFRDCERILTYMPMRDEVDLRPLLERHPHKQWYLPRILPAGRMTFHLHHPDRLSLHPYGMLEPDSDLPDVGIEAIELALVPGLAFDCSGWRLGYGGGFFDRFLAGYAGASLGVTYEALLVDQLPHQAHDVPVQYLVTEERLFSQSNLELIP